MTTFRFEVRSGDQWQTDVVQGKTVERCEFSQQQDIAYSTVYSLSWSFRVGSFVNGASFFILGQMHAASNELDGRSPWFAVQLQTDGSLKIGYRYYVEPTDNANTLYTLATVADFARDAWYDVVVKLNADPTIGEATVWLNGTQIGTYSGPLGYHDQTDAGYWKFGIYRGQDTSTAVAEFANMRIGTADLTDKITNPDPV